MEEGSAYDMLTKNIASLLQLRVEEVQSMIPYQEHVKIKDNEVESVSGTSGYGSQVGVSPPPAPRPASFLRQLRGRGTSDSTDFAYPSSAFHHHPPGVIGERRRESDEQLREIQAELAKGGEKRVPKPGYLCRICFTPGHLIFDCPSKHLTQCLTPYKGPKQCYGEFSCGPCKRKWRSGKSFANTPQPCKSCQHPVYPHRQYSLEKAIEEGKWPARKESV